jgi:predicted nucleic acid-binding protein
MWESFVGDTIYLDTNIIIYAVESGNRWSKVLHDLFEAVDDRAVHTFTSELPIAEVLAKPMEVGATDLIRRYEEVLAPDGLIKVIPIDRPILRIAASLQLKLGVKLADSIHLATSKAYSCDFFLTNDDRLGRKIVGDFQWLELGKIERGV